MAWSHVRARSKQVAPGFFRQNRKTSVFVHARHGFKKNGPGGRFYPDYFLRGTFGTEDLVAEDFEVVLGAGSSLPASTFSFSAFFGAAFLRCNCFFSAGMSFSD